MILLMYSREKILTLLILKLTGDLMRQIGKVLKGAVFVGVAFTEMSFAVEQKLSVSVDVSLNQKEIGECSYYISEKLPGMPPGVPRNFDGDVLISSDAEGIEIKIVCVKKKGLQDAIEILQIIGGIR